MLTFFRRIRKGFFDTGRVGKYIIYAIGEVALVVIGILIALQINNWNEGKKDKNLENIVLEDIKGNIIRNHDLIQKAIATIDEINKSTEIINNAIQLNLPYSDTLNYHFNQAQRSGTFLFKLNADGYESLQSIGFNIIRNEELKDEILSLFEVTYGYVLTTLQFANNLFFADSNWWKKYFYKNDLGDIVPYNKKEILGDKRVLTEINDIAFIRNDFQRSLKESLAHSQKVLQLVNDELADFSSMK